MFDGTKRDLETARTFINSFPRYFEVRATELGCVDSHGIVLTEGWTLAAMLQLRDGASRWADDNFPRGMRPDWYTFTASFLRHFTPADALSKLKNEWESLSIKRSERAATFNERFQALRARLNPYAPIPPDLLLDSYRAKIQTNKEVAAIFSMIQSMHPHWTMEQYMLQVAESDAIQHGSLGGAAIKDKEKGNTGTGSKGGANGTATKGSLKRMEGRTDANSQAGEMTCYSCHEKGHQARNCPHVGKMSLPEMQRTLEKLLQAQKAAMEASKSGKQPSAKKGRGTRASKPGKRLDQCRISREEDQADDGQEDSDEDLALSDSGNGEGDC
jgi:hypothetical protein